MPGAGRASGIAASKAPGVFSKINFIECVTKSGQGHDCLGCCGGRSCLHYDSFDLFDFYDGVNEVFMNFLLARRFEFQPPLRGIIKIK